MNLVPLLVASSLQRSCSEWSRADIVLVAKDDEPAPLELGHEVGRNIDFVAAVAQEDVEVFRHSAAIHPDVCKRPFIHAAFSVDACASPVERHRHGSSSSILLMG